MDNFNWKIYLNKNPHLIDQGINTRNKAFLHWSKNNKKENKTIKKENKTINNHDITNNTLNYDINSIKIKILTMEKELKKLKEIINNIQNNQIDNSHNIQPNIVIEKFRFDKKQVNIIGELNDSSDDDSF